MEASGNASGLYANPSPRNVNASGEESAGVGVNDGSRRGLGMLQISALNFLQSPLSFVLEYSEIVPARSKQREGDGVVTINGVNGGAVAPRVSVENCAGTSGDRGISVATNWRSDLCSREGRTEEEEKEKEKVMRTGMVVDR